MSLVIVSYTMKFSLMDKLTVLEDVSRRPAPSARMCVYVCVREIEIQPITQNLPFLKCVVLKVEIRLIL